MAQKESITVPYSRFKEHVLEKLLRLEYVKEYHKEGDKIKTLFITLLYNDRTPSLTGVNIFSKPGRRYYVSYKSLKSVLGGLGFAILSTSKGICTGQEARKEKIGGELLFTIW